MSDAPTTPADTSVLRTYLLLKSGRSFELHDERDEETLIRSVEDARNGNNGFEETEVPQGQTWFATAHGSITLRVEDISGFYSERVPA